jgi:hypothetical protein
VAQVADRPHVEAEALLDLLALPEGELAAAAAGVEDDQRPLGHAEPGPHREVGQPALLLARDHRHGEPGAGPDRRDDLLAVAGDP